MKHFYVYTSAITVILLSVVKLSNSEFYSAMAEMEKLLHSEREIANSLDKYLKIEEERLAKVKRLKEQYDELNKAAEKDVVAFLSNPVNAFVLLKRLTADWNSVRELVQDIVGQNVIYNTTYSQLLPGYEDLKGAAEALIRLQNVYLLNTTALASGRIQGAVAATNLTASDCFELGRQAYDKGYYKQSVSWLKEALLRLEREESSTTKKFDVFDYMAASYFRLGNYTASIQLVEQMTILDPYHARAAYDLMNYRILAAKEEYKMKIGVSDQEEGKEEIIDVTSYKLVQDKYEKLCRGESLKTPKENSKLNCYRINNSGYLLLQPAKVEVLSLDPRIVLFHDAVKDAEINVLKSVAIPKLKKATVINSNTGEAEFADYRVSKSAWMEEYEHEVFYRLNRRIEDLTGLDCKHAEHLHVINYGIAGHYAPHADFSRENEVMNFAAGNRIATWIVYLSDVPAGGSTVFPHIDVEVKPVKGAAVFWHNLFKSGYGDERTVHAACPVLSGSKWVATKWLHEMGNEFKRPCTEDRWINT